MWFYIEYFIDLSDLSQDATNGMLKVVNQVLDSAKLKVTVD